MILNSVYVDNMKLYKDFTRPKNTIKAVPLHNPIKVYEELTRLDKVCQDCLGYCTIMGSQVMNTNKTMVNSSPYWIGNGSCITKDNFELNNAILASYRAVNASYTNNQCNLYRPTHESH